MKAIFFVALFLSIIQGGVDMAYAEKFYLYREVAQQMKPESHIYGFDIKTMFSDLNVGFMLPNQTESGGLFWFEVSASVKPESHSQENYYLDIITIRIRDEKKVLKLNTYSFPNKKFGNMVIIGDDKVSSKSSISITKTNRFAGGLAIETKKVPQKLYLDYKLRFTSNKGEVEILEGTIEMVRAHYNVSWFEKIRR